MATYNRAGWSGNKAVEISAAITMTDEDNGKIFLMTGGTYAVTTPTTLVAGWNAQFVWSSATAATVNGIAMTATGDHVQCVSTGTAIENMSSQATA
jgi:hypothetical protein